MLDCFATVESLHQIDRLTTFWPLLRVPCSAPHGQFEAAGAHEQIVTSSLAYGSVELEMAGSAARPAGNMFFAYTGEYCHGGELLSYLVSAEAPYIRVFSEPTARRLFRELLEGVAHLHRVGCCHRDIRLENIMLMPPPTFSVRVSDFGEATFSAEGTSRLPHAPDDVWACGVVLFALLAGGPLFERFKESNFTRAFQYMASHGPGSPPLPPQLAEMATLLSPATEEPQHPNLWRTFGAGLSDDVRECLGLCFDRNPHRRIAAAALLQHRWVQAASAPASSSFIHFLSACHSFRCPHLSVAVHCVVAGSVSLGSIVRLTATVAHFDCVFQLCEAAWPCTTTS
jgi:serine/threonine protein kinase